MCVRQPRRQHHVRFDMNDLVHPDAAGFGSLGEHGALGGQLARQHFIVGVVKAYELASTHSYSNVARPRFADVLVEANEAVGAPFSDAAGAVTGTIVDNDELNLWSRLSANAFDCAGEPLFRVLRGDADADEHEDNGPMPFRYRS